jgi:phospholipid-translocating ATPase
MFFEYTLVALYNLIFTSLPIIFLGIWDQDVNARISQLYPEMYRMGLRNDKFKSWRFYLTIFDAIFQSVICFFFPFLLLIGGPIDPYGRDQHSVYEFGTIVASIAVFVANFIVMFSLYSFTWIQVLVISLSILAFYAFICIIAQFNTFIFAGQDALFGTGLYWMMLILTVVTCYIPRICAKHYLHQYHPNDNDIVREQELVLRNGRSTKTHSDHTTNANSFETKTQTEGDLGSNHVKSKFGFNLHKRK